MKDEFDASTVKVTEDTGSLRPRRGLDADIVTFEFPDKTAYAIVPHPLKNGSFAFVLSDGLTNGNKLKNNELKYLSDEGHFTEYGTVYPSAKCAIVFEQILPHIGPPFGKNVKKPEPEPELEPHLS